MRAKENLYCPVHRSPYGIPRENEEEKCHAAISAGKMSRSRSTASTAEKTSAMSTGCRPTMHAPALRNGKRPRRPVGIRDGPGGATPYGGGYATVPPGKKPGRLSGGCIPFLKIAVTVIVIIFIVLLFLGLSGHLLSG